MIENTNNWGREDILKLSIIAPNLPDDTMIFSVYESFDHFMEQGFDIVFPRRGRKIFSEEEEANKPKDHRHILEQCARNNIKYLTFFDDEYPELLRHIYEPPTVVYYKGNLQDSGKRVAIVGTRRCSDYGKFCTEYFAEAFAKADITVVSGLAYGVDTYSHLAAIKHGGKTFAVIASGIDKISPTAMEINSRSILESGGAIISTYAPGVSAIPPYFLQRNRIISGLSQATLVVESDYKGGSLNTARNANEQNRLVFAIPGRINSTKSRGTNKLIEDSKAALASSPENVIRELGFEKPVENLFSVANQGNSNLSEVQDTILSHFAGESLSIDELSDLSGLDITTIMSELFTMELMGAVKQVPGNRYMKVII